MCYSFSLSKPFSELEERFAAKMPSEVLVGTPLGPMYHINAFNLPSLPVITSAEPDKFSILKWGLVPHWCKSFEIAEEMRLRTLNARSETIFEKPSFREPAKNKRCLIPMDGFFEWREVSGKKYPYFIKMKDGKPFAVAGLWDEWLNKITGEIIRSFTLITTEANPLLEKIHNTKRRMPAILEPALEQAWLDLGSEQETLEGILQPIDDSNLTAYTISKLITTRGAKTNTPEVSEKFEYPDLRGLEI